MDDDNWPACEARYKSEKCEGEVDPKRWALGYRTCIECGSPSIKRTIAPAYNKGPVMLIGRKDIKDIGR